VGQDLIKAAGIRATVAQIEKYNTAVNTFQGKFGGIPGDIYATTATAFGLYAGAGSTGRGDGNGLIDGTVATPSAWSQEGGMFWVHLTQAGLLDGNFASGLDGSTPVAIVAASAGTTWPSARIGRGNYFNVGSAGGQNFYIIAGLQSAATTGSLTTTLNLTPIELYNIDVKLDDGAPITGIVQSRGGNGTATASTVGSITLFTDGTTSSSSATVGSCNVGDAAGTATTNTYNRNLTLGGSTPSCVGRFRMN
jgi:hypothetical protein